MNKQATSLAGIVEILYNRYLARYNAKEVASVATAATINELLIGRGKVGTAS